jgi:hypothetical protein
MEKIEFVAYLPPIQSALNIGGEEGAVSRIKIDAPGTEIAEVVKLLLLRGKVFKVTIEEVEDGV